MAPCRPNPKGARPLRAISVLRGRLAEVAWLTAMRANIQPRPARLDLARKRQAQMPPYFVYGRLAAEQRGRLARDQVEAARPGVALQRLEPCASRRGARRQLPEREPRLERRRHETEAHAFHEVRLQFPDPVL